MAKIEGFSFFEKMKIKDAMKDARKCLDKALIEAFDRNNTFQTRISIYFGDGPGGASATHHAVMKTLNSMKLCIDTDAYIIRRGSNSDANAGANSWMSDAVNFRGSDQKKARATRYQGTMIYEGKQVNVLEAQLAFASEYGSSPLNIYDNYFHLPYKQLDNQSQVECFLHELSHTAAGTIDVDAPKCYGFSGVLYCKDIGKAAHNAENYGMFLQSYLFLKT